MIYVNPSIGRLEAFERREKQRIAKIRARASSQLDSYPTTQHDSGTLVEVKRSSIDSGSMRK